MAAPNDLLQESAPSDDSDPEPDAADHNIYYHPISFHSTSDSDSESDNISGSGSVFPILPNGGNLNHHQIPNSNPNPNPNFIHFHAENGISALDLNVGVEDVEEEEGEEEVEREREASILRAFREDESRRSAPLTPENASRIMDAMRGVNFPGYPPDWADRVPDDRWVEQLRRLRGETAPQS